MHLSHRQNLKCQVLEARAGDQSSRKNSCNSNININSGTAFVKAYLKVHAQVNNIEVNSIADQFGIGINIARNNYIPNDDIKSSAYSILT